jgi:hypothetical protein
MLDASSGDTAAFSLTAEIVVAAGTDGCLNVALNPHFTQNHLAITTSALATPTSGNQNSWWQQTAVMALDGNIRYVGGCLQVRSGENDDNKVGRMVAGRCTKVIRTSSAPTWSTQAELTEAMIDRGGRFSASLPDDGCKVRMQPFGPRDREFATIGASAPSLVEGKVENVTGYPTILIAGANSGDTFTVKAIVHCEYVSNMPDLLTLDSSPYSPRYEMIIANATANPVYATGHSFMSFVKSVQTATKYAARITQAALPYVSTGATIAGTLASLALV